MKTEFSESAVLTRHAIAMGATLEDAMQEALSASYREGTSTRLIDVTVTARFERDDDE